MSNHIGPVLRIVVCAANRYHGEYIFLGARHFDRLMTHAIIEADKTKLIDTSRGWPEQGFIDQHGVYMDRKEALIVATAAGQINTQRTKTNPLDELFSEDLY